MSRFKPSEDIEFQPLETIVAEQDQLLREHLVYCVEKSPYYREKLADLDLSTIPLHELPVTDKEQAQREFKLARDHSMPASASR